MRKHDGRESVGVALQGAVSAEEVGSKGVYQHREGVWEGEMVGKNDGIHTY